MPDLPSSLFRRSGPPPLWTSETLFLEGDDYYEAMFKDLEGARSLVTVEMYIFEVDELGTRLYRALEACAARGVAVHLLLDAVGSHALIQRLLGSRLPAGMKLKVFNPHPWTYVNRTLGDYLRSLRTFFTKLAWVNRRDHRKIVTIDERITYMGSFNVSADHLKTVRAEAAWRDLGLRLTGFVASLFILSMMRSWGIREFFRYRKRLPNKRYVRFDHPDVRLNQTFYLRRKLYKDFLKRVKNARHRVWLRPGYFLPKRRLVKLLAQAAKRGVDVRVLLSNKSDVFYYSLLQTCHDPFLVKSGVKIFHYLPTITHAKNYFIDDWVTVGSTNLNHRSFLHDLEVDVRVQHPDNRRILSESFEQMVSDAIPVTTESLRARPWWERWAARTIFLFRYWN